MNRFLSRGKTFPAAFAFFAAVAVAVLPARAQSLISNNAYSLTFPSGWLVTSIGSGDSASSYAQQISSGAIGVLYGLPGQGSLTAEQLATLAATYGAADSLGTTGGGTKTLGGKQFSIINAKSIAAGSSDSNLVRVYFHSQGDYLFVAELIYNPSKVGTAITEFEGALGTLAISPSVAVRAKSVSLRPALAGAGHDALGRTALPVASKRFGLLLFLRR
jgi:hypothetical protein